LIPHRTALLIALAATAIVLWDASGLDMPAARLFGGADGFPLKENAWIEAVLHRGMRNLSWSLWGLMVVGSVFPIGFLRRLQVAERMQLWVSVLGGLVVISVLKRLSDTSCPWDLQAFGGTAEHVSHWAIGRRDGGGGHCFPAGHASAGFAFIGSWFALHRRLPRLARAWWWASVAAGVLLGLSQQMRGAHFMSHTLWSGWLCWTTGALIDAAFQWNAGKRKIFPVH